MLDLVSHFQSIEDSQANGMTLPRLVYQKILTPRLAQPLSSFFFRVLALGEVTPWRDIEGFYNKKLLSFVNHHPGLWGIVPAAIGVNFSDLTCSSCV